MKIKTVSIAGYKGIDDITFQPGSITELSGKNGVNKSAVIEALMALLSHDHDPDRIKTGSDKAVVKIALDNSHTYKMTTRLKGSVWDFKDAEGRPMKKTAALLKGIIHGLALDPLSFIDMKDKDQVHAFIQALPLTIQEKDFAILQIPMEFLNGISFDQHALYVLGNDNSGVYGNIFKLRTDVNRDMKASQSAAVQLDSAIEAVPTAPEGKTWSQVATEATADYSAAYNKLMEVNSQVKGAFDDDAESRRKAHEQKLFDLQATYQAAVTAARETYDTTEAQMNQGLSDSLEKVREEFDAQLQQLSNNQTKATELSKVEAGQLKTKQLIEHHIQKAQEGETYSQALTDYLDKLKAYKANLLKASPIPGLEVIDGVLYYEGVKFKTTNKSKQIELAVKIASLNPGDFGVSLVDNLESLDDQNYWSLVFAMTEACEKLGMQFFGARVTNDPGLNVKVLKP